MPSQIDYPGLGTVVIMTHPAARRFVARWKQGAVRLTVPPRSSLKEIYGALAELAPRLIKSRPAAGSLLLPDTVIEQPGMRVRILDNPADSSASLRTSASLSGDRYEIDIFVGAGIDRASDSYAPFVSRAVVNVAGKIAPRILIPFARSVAGRVGDSPLSWRIGSGMRILGTCSAGRIITLSRALMFLPADLRESIVCHELAHLREMNHGPRFHAILESYFPGHLEARRRLLSFDWPILR